MKRAPWSVTCLEFNSPAISLPPTSSPNPRVLEGIKVLELCRIIAGPTIARILGEYGADVIKVTGPGLSDVPFFQVDGNMGKHATELDLKSPEGKKVFEGLLKEADILVDGYRPGALDKLGYGAKALAEFGRKRKKGIVYVNENCFGYDGEWAGRAGWQQIADCVSYHLHLSLTAPAPYPLFLSTANNSPTTGKRRSLGTRPLHEPFRTHRPSFPHLRLRHRLHGRHRRSLRTLPPHHKGRILARQSLPPAIRPPPLQRRPLFPLNPRPTPLPTYTRIHGVETFTFR
jgi:hypothetical protein